MVNIFFASMKAKFHGQSISRKDWGLFDIDLSAMYIFVNDRCHPSVTQIFL